MENRPLVSVVVPTYNFGKYISKCVDSILKQSYDNIEIIIVNDGSTDDTKNILEELRKGNANIKVINKANEGVSTARNIGLEIASGEYIIFVDGDDYLSEDAVEYLVGLVDKPKADFGLSKNCFMREGEYQVVSDNIKELGPQDATTLLLSPALIVGCWNKIYRKSVLDKYSIRFNPELFYGEGLRFINQMAMISNKVVVGERKVYFYRRNNYSSATSAFNIEKFKNGLKSIELIGDDLNPSWLNAKKMWDWHKCQFYMGIVIRIKEADHPAGTKDFYRSALRELRKDSYKFLGFKNLPAYNRLILFGTSISPILFAWLDKKRRKYIAKNSVE